jgi:hypothetical protein
LNAAKDAVKEYPALATPNSSATLDRADAGDVDRGVKVEVREDGSPILPDTREDLTRRIEEKKRGGMSHEDAAASAQEDLTAEASARLDTEGEILVDEYGDQYRVNHERSERGGPKNLRTLTRLTKDGVPYEDWINPKDALLMARRMRKKSEIAGTQPGDVDRGVGPDDVPFGSTGVPEYGVYKINLRNAGVRYAVRGKSASGFGDTIFPTKAEAEAHAVETKERNDANAESAKKQAEQQAERDAKAAKARAERENLDGFAATLPPMQRGKVVANLDTLVNVRGNIATVREQVRSLVNNGGVPSTREEPKIKPMSRMQAFRADQRQQDAHAKRMREAGNKTVYLVDGVDLGKTAYDYATFLKNPPATPTPNSSATLDRADAGDVDRGVKAYTDFMTGPGGKPFKTRELLAMPDEDRNRIVDAATADIADRIRQIQGVKPATLTNTQWEARNRRANKASEIAELRANASEWLNLRAKPTPNSSATLTSSSNFAAMLLPELRAEAARRGLPTTGTKKVLVGRLSQNASPSQTSQQNPSQSATSQSPASSPLPNAGGGTADLRQESTLPSGIREGSAPPGQGTPPSSLPSESSPKSTRGVEVAEGIIRIDGTAKEAGTIEARRLRLLYKQKENGWIRHDTEDGAVLVHPSDDRVVRFKSTVERSGGKRLEAMIRASAFAQDNPVSAKPVEAGEMVVKDLRLGEGDAARERSDTPAWQMRKADVVGGEGRPANLWRVPLDEEAAKELSATERELAKVSNRDPKPYSAGDIVEMYGFRGANLHKAIIERALAAGKPVPPSVLADYPDLKPPAKAGEKPTPKPKADAGKAEEAEAKPDTRTPMERRVAERMAELNPQTPLEQTAAEREVRQIRRNEQWRMTEDEFVAQEIEADRKRHENGVKNNREELAGKVPPKKRQTLEAQIEFWSRRVAGLSDPKSSEYTSAVMNAREKWEATVKAAISKGLPVPREIIDGNAAFEKAAGGRARYDKGRRTSFANQTEGVDSSTVESRGFKSKRQDGKPIPESQRKSIEAAVTEVEEVLGDLSDLMRDTNLTIAHTSGLFPFMNSSAGGMYHPTDRTITMGTQIGPFLQKALAHEFGHWLDFEAGRAAGVKVRMLTKGGKSWEGSSLSEASAKFSSDDATKAQQAEERSLIERASQSMTDPYKAARILRADPSKATTQEEKDLLRSQQFKLTPYWRDPREVWSRLFEQYVGTKRGKSGESHETEADYQSAPAWWSKDAFEKLMPQLERVIAAKVKMIRDVKAPDKVADPTLADKVQSAAKSIGDAAQARLDKVNKGGKKLYSNGFIDPDVLRITRDTALVLAARAIEGGIKGGRALTELARETAREFAKGRAIDWKVVRRMAAPLVKAASDPDPEKARDNFERIVAEMRKPKPAKASVKGVREATGVVKPKADPVTVTTDPVKGLATDLRQSERETRRAYEAGKADTIKEGTPLVRKMARIIMGEEKRTETALTAAMRKAERAANRAFREGRREGIAASLPALRAMESIIRSERKLAANAAKLASRTGIAVEKARQQLKDAIRQQVLDLAATVDPKVRGKLLKSLAKADTWQKQRKAVRQLITGAEILAGKQAYAKVRGLLKPTKLKAVKGLTNDLREKLIGTNPKMLGGVAAEAARAAEVLKRAARREVSITKPDGTKGTRTVGDVSLDDIIAARTRLETLAAESALDIKIARSAYKEIKGMRGLTAAKVALEASESVKARRTPIDTQGKAMDPKLGVGGWLRMGASDVRVILARMEGADGPMAKVVYDRLAKAESEMGTLERKSIEKADEVAKAAGFKDLDDADEVLNSFAGDGATERLTIRVGGKEINLTLGQAVDLYGHYTDSQTAALIAGEQEFTVEGGEETVRFNPDPIDSISLRLLLEEKRPGITKLIDGMKEVSDLYYDERAKVVYRLTGTMPPKVEGRWRRDRYIKNTPADKDALPSTPREYLQGLLENAGTNTERVQTTGIPILLRNPVSKLRDDIRESTQTVAMAEPIRDALNVLSNEELVREAAKRHPGAVDVLRKLVVSTYATQPMTRGGKAASFINRNMAVSSLATNPASIMVNLVGAVRMMPDLATSDFVGSLSDLRNARSLAKDMKQRSGFFFQRYGTSAHARMMMIGTSPKELPALRSFGRAIRAATANVKARDGKAAFRNLRDAMGASLELYNLADIPLSIMAYAAKIRESKATHKGLNWSEDQHRDWAVREAERIIRDTQPGASGLDAASLPVQERGRGTSAFFLFSSDTFRARNRINLAFHKSRSYGLKVLASETANILIGRVARRMVSLPLALAALAAVGGDEEDYEKVIGRSTSLGAFGFDVAADAAGLVAPIGAPQMVSMLRGFTPSGAVMAPGQSGIAEAATAIQKAGLETADAVERWMDGRPVRVGRLLAAWAGGTNEAISASVGNPAAPWVRIVMRAWRESLRD